MKPILIIGGGPAGISAAIWAARLHQPAILFSAGALGGRLLTMHNCIPDYPGFYNATPNALIDAWLYHLGAMQIPWQNSPVLQCDLKNKTIQTATAEHEGQAIVFATGTKDRRLDPTVYDAHYQSQSISASIDASKFRNKVVAVVGGGDRALENAILFAEHGATVHLIHYKHLFRARDHFVQKVLHHPAIHLHLEYHVTQLSQKESIEQIVLEHQPSQKQMTLQADATVVRIGTLPHDDLIPTNVKRHDNGFIQVNAGFETTIPDIYAIGDLITPVAHASIIQAMGQGAALMTHLVKNMNSQKT